jgi:parallel beta-helix repeat protein
VEIKGSRFDTSPNGSGIALDHSSEVNINNCEIARNGYYGVLISESNNVTVKGNLIEANDRSGVLTEFLDKGCSNINVTNNTIQYNNGFGVESYAAVNSKAENNTYAGNGNNTSQQQISTEKKIVME